MSRKMLKFINLKQETPVKRSTSQRKDDFNEIYDEFKKNKKQQILLEKTKLTEKLKKFLKKTFLFQVFWNYRNFTLIVT